ncbi:DASH family cryptochrome [Vibrio rotiferianus]|uniref:DASH family cryptochrome n=1 Tax=Vibrio rotiferianus TaxID=190895 RepID=UPI00148C7BFF|nr:DASH family cryptochrome [Vibrio rotiferianus]NOH66724.1 DASH family cryptochrome [Vibrio rotiferianus]
MSIGLYWFTNDLRVHDNPNLTKATSEVDLLVCLYCYPKISSYLAQYAQVSQFGVAKQQFLDESLFCLNSSLNTLNQRLLVVILHPYHAIKHAIENFGVTRLYVSAISGCDEQAVLAKLQVEYPHISVVQQEAQSLFCASQLPFKTDDLPDTFTKFRKQVEALHISEPVEKVSVLPPAPETLPISTLSLTPDLKPALFSGGEQAGLEHSRQYFSSTLASEYKQTRNGLYGMDYSTKFSPWLAHGCLSPKTIYAMLKRYEAANGANDSTYWIYFELLWREYFYWYARRYGRWLFRFGGIRNQAPLTSFYAHRFQQWKKGETPFPIVNACMHQLNETGYMSNRGRQLVASCLVHELGLDWRYGAAYFETQLIDYDVASNWGNWQYLAGVGADPRGSRQFNLEKQTEMYDPHMEFIDRWQGRCAGAHLDSVDMVDWPIVMGSSDKASSSEKP